jgi:hypothetical protein
MAYTWHRRLMSWRIWDTDCMEDGGLTSNPRAAPNAAATSAFASLFDLILGVADICCSLHISQLSLMRYANTFVSTVTNAPWQLIANDRWSISIGQVLSPAASFAD